MRVLITGGAGFIGSHLVDTLSTDQEVTVLDDGSTGNLAGIPDSITLIKGDVRDRPTVEQAIDNADVVFHQAGLVSVAQSVQSPPESHTINATGTLNVLEAARDTDPRIVVASSAAVYGQPKTLPIEEVHPTEPTSPYGLDKLYVDHHTRIYHDHYDVDTVALRYFNVYGPDQTGGDYAGVISTFIDQALNGDDITVHGDGDQTRDFVFVEDVVRANHAAMETDHVGETYNIGTGDSVSIRELAELIQDITDTDSDVVHTDPRAGDIGHSVADISKTVKHLDFTPTVSLRQGLEHTIQWWRTEKSET